MQFTPTVVTIFSEEGQLRFRFINEKAGMPPEPFFAEIHVSIPAADADTWGEIKARALAALKDRMPRDVSGS